VAVTGEVVLALGVDLKAIRTLALCVPQPHHRTSLTEP
jgi:hypothetical protein